MYHIFLCTAEHIDRPFYYVIHNEITKDYSYDLAQAFFTSTVRPPNNFPIIEQLVASVNSFDELEINYPELLL